VTTVDVLFEETGSVVVVLTVAEFVRVPAVPGDVPVTEIVIGLAPLATVPRLHVIVLGVPPVGAPQLPEDVVAETPVSVEGSVSTTETADADDSPRFET
jgi:hypothetical protein